MRDLTSPVVLAIASALLASAPAAAQSTLYVDNLAPFSYRENGVLKGVLYDMVRDLAARVGNQGEIQSVPPRRELVLVASSTDALGTMGRLPENEASYTWLCDLIDDRIVLVSSAASSVDIASVEAAKNLRVGVILGGPADGLLRRLGFGHVEPTATAENNARKLMLGRIDAVAAAWNVARYGQLLSGGDVRQLRAGAVLQPLSIYLAGPRSLPPRVAGQWRAACDAMRKDGSYARILRAYQIAPPK